MPLRGVEVERRPGPGERPARPGERRIRERRHQGPAEPAARARDGDPHRQSASAGAGQAGAVLALVVGVPVARPDGPPPAPRSRRTSRPWRRSPRRTTSGCASRAPPASSRPSRSAGRGPGRSATVRTSDQGLPRRSRRAVDHLAVRQLDRARHVVRLAGRAVAQDVLDRAGVVGDVQPVAPLEAVAVERQRQVVERVRDEQRDELLGVVERAVRVRAAGDDGVDAVGHDVAPDEELAGGLGGAVRRARREPVVLARQARSRPSRRPRRSRPGGAAAARPARRPAPGRARAGTASSRTWTPMTPVTRNASGSRIERSTCDSAAKLTTASVSATSGADDVRVGDVAADEAEPGGLLRVGPDGRQVGLVAGVGELVEDRDPRPVAPGEHVADEAAADEPGAAGDEEVRAGLRPGRARASRGSSRVARRRLDGRVVLALSGRCGGRLRRPSAASASAIWAARRSDGTVPASVQCPS